jgi:hypothetical protein
VILAVILAAIHWRRLEVADRQSAILETFNMSPTHLSSVTQLGVVTEKWVISLDICLSSASKDDSNECLNNTMSIAGQTGRQHGCVISIHPEIHHRDAQHGVDT